VIDRGDGSPYQLKRFKYNSHDWILRWLSEASVPSRILDVGAADGYLGAILKQRGHFVAGVENDPDAAAKAQGHYDDFQVANVEEFDFPYRDEFDYILFADVLEHLRDPARVLKKSLTSLKRSGQIILSVPNIANVVMRLSLLAGRFNYADRGIMDRTHLRFFTLATLKRTLEECGLGVVEIAASPLPVQLVWPFTDAKWFAPMHELHYLLVRMRMPLFAYQFIVRSARRSAPGSNDSRHESIPFAI
jgi:SAM-dependent methyltransferase